MNLQEVCRTCLRSGRTMSSLFDSTVSTFDSESMVVSVMLTFSTEIQVSDEDGLPNQICTDCFDEIQRSYSFKLKCQRSEAILHQLKDGQQDQDNSIIELLDAIECTSFDVEDSIIEDVKQETDHEIVFKDEDHEMDVENHEIDAEENREIDTEDHEIDTEDHEINTKTYESEDQLVTTIIFRCPGCPVEGISLKILGKHIIDNHIENNFCKICNGEFNSSSIQHCSEHLPDRRDIRLAAKNSRKKSEILCEICAKTFKCKSHLIRHMVSHTGEKPYQCEICLRSFQHKSGLRYHMRSVHDIFDSTNKKDFQCTICSKVIGNKFNLREHMRAHSSHRSFKCKICKKAFRYNTGLKYHMKMVHEMFGFTELKDLQCSICSKIWGNKYDLRVHMRLHTGDKPFQCEICSETFRYKRDLIFHVGRNHANEEAVQDIYKCILHCEICSKMFTCKSSLIMHSRSHTKERPFKCETCSKVFSYKDRLQKHIRAKHTQKDCAKDVENDSDT